MRDRQRAGSLLSVLDQTSTSMGARWLATWLANPLTNITDITLRHGAIEELVSDNRLRNGIREAPATFTIWNDCSDALRHWNRAPETCGKSAGRLPVAETKGYVG